LLRWHGGEGPYKRKDITVGEEWIDKWKVITSKVSYDHAGLPDANGFRRVFSIIDILPPGTICTETYLVVGAFDTEGPAKNLADYLRTRFVRFLVSQLSFSQDIFKEKFAFVPALSMRRKWTDETLYNRYEISDDEIAFIESKIRPMQADSVHIMSGTFFPPKPATTPTIYAYESTHPQHKGMLKIGYTTRDAATRVAEQHPIVTPGDPIFKVVLEESAIPQQRNYIH
jgi:hypothetical protein